MAAPRLPLPVSGAILLTLISVIIGFIFLSGLLAMVDAAVLSVSRAEIEEMVVHHKPGAAALRALHKNLTRAVAVIVIATNIVNILGPILAGQAAIMLFGSSAIGFLTVILTCCTIVFSEVIPKSFGAHHAPRISRTAAPVILTLTYALYPLVIGLEYLARFFQSGERKIGTEAQIRSLVSLGHRAGHIESDEGQLIHRAFILNDKTAGDIMVPVGRIVSVTMDTTVREAAQKVFKETFSRYPVFGDSIHDPRGLVMSQDILEALSEGRDDETIGHIMREVIVVKAEKKCDKLMAKFRDRKVHLAIVQKNRKTVGLVTLENVLEQLVGDIEDEFDSDD